LKVHQAHPTGPPLDELQLTNETEMGELYIDGNGFLVFRSRSQFFTDTRTRTSQATFGDNPNATGTSFLTGDASGFEGGIANWAGQTNITISQTAAQAHTGTKSLSMSSNAAGNMSAISCLTANIAAQGMACLPGDLIPATAWYRTAVSARSCNIGV